MQSSTARPTMLIGATSQQRLITLLIIYYIALYTSMELVGWLALCSPLSDSTLQQATEDMICADNVVETAAWYKAQLIAAIRLRLR